MVTNKRGRKSKTPWGTENRLVKTWGKIDGEWVYIGMSLKQIAGITINGEYAYFTSFGKEYKQEL